MKQLQAVTVTSLVTCDIFLWFDFPVITRLKFQSQRKVFKVSDSHSKPFASMLPRLDPSFISYLFSPPSPLPTPSCLPEFFSPSCLPPSVDPHSLLPPYVIPSLFFPPSVAPSLPPSLPPSVISFWHPLVPSHLIPSVPRYLSLSLISSLAPSLLTIALSFLILSLPYSHTASLQHIKVELKIVQRTTLQKVTTPEKTRIFHN